jgi:L-iditol 2-dehydrogenase
MVTPTAAIRRSLKANLALKVTPDHRIYIDEIPYPIAGPDEAIVHVKATG